MKVSIHIINTNTKIRDDDDYLCVDVDRNFHQIFSKIRDDGDYVCVDDVDRNFHENI
jgi:hypothetical protein